MKDKVTREVARMYKDLEFSVRADDWDKYPGFLRLPLEFSVRADDWDKYPGFLRLPLVNSQFRLNFTILTEIHSYN